VAPAAKVLGFVSYGYAGYMNLQGAPDSNGRNFIEWYLGQARAGEASAGRRLIDYLDLHWYPEARGGGARITDGDASPGVVAARVQAPRSLWDASYREDSWIANDVLGGPIDLLTDLKAKIAAHYPGTELSFTEWNFGGGDHVSGAVAVADVLGIFGREGVGLATYWGLKADETFALAAFRAYRSYDGNGSAFGDTAVESTSSNVPMATVYGSIDGANPRRTVIVAINKDTAARTAGIRITQGVRYATASVWVLSGGTAEVQPAPALTPVDTNAFSYSMPALSVSVIVPSP
jgi:hypothetical protein